MHAPVRLHREDSGVSPVIGEVLMVAITIVLAIVVLLIVSGIANVPDEQKVTAKLSTPRVQQYDRNGTTVFDATCDILTLTLDNEIVTWSVVKVFMKSINGSVMHTVTDLMDDGNSTYDDEAPIDVEFWYVDVTTADPKMSPGDSIKITGMDISYEGATLELLFENDIIGRITLPTNFT